MEFSHPRRLAADLRGILADTSIAEHQRHHLAPLSPTARRTERVTHRLHTAAHNIGQTANRGYERSSAFWNPAEAPVANVENITVFAYGNEKIAYKLTTATGEAHVVSVYHVNALFSDPDRLLARKQANYDIYRKYFGALVKPTEFLLVNNPWGEGKKPAALLGFIEDKEEFQSYNAGQLRTRAETDADFATSLHTLQQGYSAMRRDNLYPDISGSNLVISGSNIVIFDTGHVFTKNQARIVKRIHKNYPTLEELTQPATKNS
jgi:hypothetical protein